MPDQLEKTNRHESNPFRPDIPESIRDLSPELYEYLLTSAETLREQHNVTQAGSSTFSWEELTILDELPRYTLGSLGRFFHEDYGLIQARYVQFVDVDQELDPGISYGLNTSATGFAWQATNRLEKSRTDLCLGIGGAYSTPPEGWCGWVIVDGANIQSLESTNEIKRFDRLAWASDGHLEKAAGDTGPIVAQAFVDSEIEDDHWKIPIGGLRVLRSDPQEIEIPSYDFAGLESQIQTFQGQLANLVGDFEGLDETVISQLTDASRSLTLMQRRIDGVVRGQVSAVTEVQETLQLLINIRQQVDSAGSNADSAASTAHINAILTNTYRRTAEFSMNQSGFFAETSTIMANEATLQRNESGISAGAAAVSASQASVSETNAGVSAAAALTSETNAFVSEGNALASAATATTQASNASTSAASAQASAVLAASIGFGALNLNPVFADWTGVSGTLPAGWFDWGNGTVNTKQTGLIGPYAYQQVVVTTTADYGLNTDTTGARGEVSPGFYVLESQVTLVAGSLQGSGVFLNVYNAASGFLTSFALRHFSDPDISRAVIGAGTVGRTYRFRKLIELPANARIIVLYAVSNNHNTLGFGAGTAKTIRWHQADIRPASDTEARVDTISDAMVDSSGNAIAAWEISTTAGSAAAAIRMRTQTGPGTYDSSIAIEAEEIQIGSLLAIKSGQGKVVLTGDLEVGGAIQIGTTHRINLALQSFKLQAGDGESIDFGVDLVNLPQFVFEIAGLAAKTASQVYDVKAINITSTGFDMYAKILTPGTTALVTSSGGSSVGGTPDWQLQKSDSADAYNGQYMFIVTLNIDFQNLVASGPDIYQEYVEYDCYVRPSGGSWTYIGTRASNVNNGTSGIHSKTLSVNAPFGDTIGQHGTDTEFGVHTVVGGTITAFSVTYTKQTTSGVSSATPNGEKVVVTVIPQNV